MTRSSGDQKLSLETIKSSRSGDGKKKKKKIDDNIFNQYYDWKNGAHHDKWISLEIISGLHIFLKAIILATMYM